MNSILLSLLTVVDSFMCDIVDFFVLAHADYYDDHLRINSDEFIYDSNVGTFELDLQQSCQVITVLVSQRFTVSAFTLWERIVTDFTDGFTYYNTLGIIK